MSRENVKKFYELAETDKDFAQKLASLDSEMALEASDLANLKDIVNEKIIPLAKEKGLEFTAEEMVEFANEKYMQLSEDDLLEVSGGVSPKAAGLTLSSVLLLSLGSAAAINLMNSNHDDVSHVVSAPSKTASEEKDESEDEEEELQKNLDEMLKKSPKGADKNANMEDLEKELDKLFKGGKLGGGSAFKPGKGRAAGKNMLNRTIGKKGTSDFAFDKFLKELDNELAKEAAASQKAKPKAATSEVSDFNFDKFMEDINREAVPGSTRTSTPAAIPVKEITKPVPTSKGTPKKIEKTKEQVEAEKKQAQQQVDAFKVKFETSFKEKFKTQRNDEDLKAFVQEYLAASGNPDGGILNNETVEFYYGFGGGSARAKVNVLDFAKELNAALPKMQYESVSRLSSWKDIMSHVMGALQNAKYDLSYFDEISLQKLQNDIDWICGKINSNGFLPAWGEDYGKNAKSTERKNIELLKALKDASYVANDDRVQTALKALSADEIKEGPVKKHDASGEDQARIEREKKEAEEKAKKEKEEQERKQREEVARKQKEAEEKERLAQEKKEAEEKARKEKEEQERKQKEEAERLQKEAEEKERLKKEAEEVVQDLKETPVEKPLTQGSDLVFENQNQIQKIVDDLVAGFKATVENAFKAKGIKTQLSEAELQQFVSEITEAMKSNQDMKKVAIVGSNTVTFFAKGQLKDGTAVEASQTVNVFELAKELNSKLPKAVEEKKDETAKPQEEIKETVVEKPAAGATDTTAKEMTAAVEEKKDESAKPQDEIKETVVEKPNAGAKITTAKELQQQAEAQKEEAETNLTNTFKAKIEANKDIELNEANLNKLLSETLDSYKGKENIMVNEKKGTITFTAKGVTKGWFVTGDDSCSATLKVREFFTKLNNEATEARRASEREDFDPAKYVAATDNDVIGGVELARKTAKKMIQEEFNKIIVAKYNAEKPAKTVEEISKIPAGKVASIVKSLKLDDVVASIVKSNIGKVDDFKIKGAKELNGQFSIKTAPENKELKIGAIGYKLTGLIGFRQPELIKYGDEISIRSEVENLKKESIEKHTVAYKKVTGENADKEVEALYKFLTDNNLLVENSTDGKSILDAIKDSDQEQFKKDVKHIAGNISDRGDKYTLTGKWRDYNVSQEKLKAIKDLAGELGV